MTDFDTSSVTNMYNMFSGCQKLEKIYASNGFITDKFEKSIDVNGNEIDSIIMFGGCTALVGGAGTSFNNSNIDKSYAHIDGGTSNPGYFTARPNYARVGTTYCSNLTDTISAISSGFSLNSLIFRLQLLIPLTVVQHLVVLYSSLKIK